MAGLDDYIVLLSSMSPKVNGTKTKTPASSIKKVSKLCLKKHFRQSLDFEKVPPRIAPAPALSTDGDSTKTASTKSSKEEVVIIPDSDGEEEEEEEKGARRVAACPALSESRYNVISNWLEKVNSTNVECGFEDVALSSHDNSLFSNFSVIYGEGRRSAGQSGAVNSTFIGDGKCLRFDQLFYKGGQANDGEIFRKPKPVKDEDVERAVRRRNAAAFKVKEDGKRKVTESKSNERRPQRETNDERNKTADVFCKTKSVCLRKNDIDMMSVKDGVVEESAAGNAGGAFKVKNAKQEVAASSINERQESNEKRKAAETKKDSSESCAVESSPYQAVLQEEQEKLLDEVYGHSWRVNKEKVFPKSETKQRRLYTPVPPPVKRREPQTEKPPKTTSAPIYKNPYLDSEVTKSRNLLRSLHTARAKKVMESPLVSRLRELCDSDTNSEGTDGSGRRKLAGTRPVFDGEESDSDKENEGALATLEERVRKKLGFEDEGDEEEVGAPSDSDVDSSGTAESDGFSDAEWTPQVVRKAITEVVKKEMAPRERKPLSFLASLSPDAPSSDCDASARLYRDNYKIYKSQLARKLFELYNERVFERAIPADTPLKWNDKLRGTAGNCRCLRNVRGNGAVQYSVSISLSTKVLDSAYRLRDTLIHEMCHAAAHMVNKVSEGHGPHWRAWASKAATIFPELPPIKVCHNYEINTKYTYKCVSCGYSFGRHSKSLNVETKRCGHCYGKFELLLNKTTKEGGVRSVPVTPKKEVTGFALFVKENYAELRTPDRRHKDVMQLLSKKFNAMKTQ